MTLFYIILYLCMSVLLVLMCVEYGVGLGLFRLWLI